ncbi:MAG: hypothetical protein ACK4TA_11420 [Saprospiraceae bacterium]
MKSFISTSFILFIIYELLHWSFYHPIITICIVGLIVNPSWIYVIYLLVYIILSFLIDSVSQHQSTYYSLREVEIDFFGKDETISLVEIPLKEFLTDTDYLNPILKRASQFNIIQNSGLIPYFTAIPVKAYLVKTKNNRLIGSAKAYVAYLSSSFIFLHMDFDEMNDHQKFIFYHELEHVKSQGLFHNIHRQSAKYWLYLNPIFLLFFISQWWHYLIIILYITVFYRFKINWMEGQREAMADNDAFRKIPKDKRIEVINSLLKLKTKELEKVKKNHHISKFDELIIRIFYLKEWKNAAIKGYEPSIIRWNYSVPYTLLFVFFLFFVFIGKINALPSNYLILIIAILIVFYYFHMKYYFNLAINQIDKVKKYVENLNKV